MTIRKLIRNGIPKVIKLERDDFSVIRLDGNELLAALKDKLLEEASEAHGAKNTEQLCDELCDLLEVIIALSHALNLTLCDIVAAADAKRNRLGGFSEGLLLIIGDDEIINGQEPLPT